jgi:hypothetical protein
MFLLSILTLTFNRPILIERLYVSLLASNLDKNLFEWVIIINGNKENLESLEKINKWRSDNKIKIRFFILDENKGYSKGLNYYSQVEIKSYYTMRLDDDDVLVRIIPKKILAMLNKFKYQNNIGFILNMIDHNNRLIGTQLPKDSIPRTNFYFYYYLKVKGDKARIYPTNLIKKFTATLKNDENFVGDSQVYYQIDKFLKLLPINFSPIIREYLPDGITKNSSKLLIENIESALNASMELFFHHEARINHKISFFLSSILVVLKAKRYRLINKIKPFALNWLVFIILYPIYKIYIFSRNSLKL